jgi:hypothetical protein
MKEQEIVKGINVDVGTTRQLPKLRLRMREKEEDNNTSWPPYLCTFSMVSWGLTWSPSCRLSTRFLH